MNTEVLLIISTLYATTHSFPALHNNAPQPTLPPNFVIAPFNNIQDITKQKIALAIDSKPFSIVPHFPDSGRKHAVLEQESFVSKLDTTYGNLQEFVASFFNPRPVVDTIQEHQKYGNDGGKSRAVGVAIIAGVEGASNLINAAIDTPAEIARQLGKKLGATLGTVGAKIGGI